MFRNHWSRWILALGLIASFGFVRPAPQPQAQVAPPQIILVIDVSGSMETRVIPNPAPVELNPLLEQIYAVENLPEIKDKEDQLKGIREQPTVVSASESLAEAEYARQVYIQDTLGVEIFEVVQRTDEILANYGCEGVGYTLVEMDSVNAAYEYIQSRCSPSPSSSEISEIENMLWFLDESEVQKFQETITSRNNEYNSALDQYSYWTISDELDTLYENNHYYDLTSDLDQRADALGLPTRLDFAKAAASSILDLIELDSRVAGQSQKVGLVTFSTYPSMLQSLTTDIASTRNLIASLESTRSTNLGGGLETALDMVTASPNPTTVILLSDGWLNVGPPRATVMGSLADRAKGQGVRVCSAGFGTREMDIDKELLETLATRTDGKYLFTASGGELVSFFIACRQSTVAANVLQFQGTVNPGESVEVGQVDVAGGSPEVTISLNFIEGDLDLILTDPSGAQVTPTYAGANQLDTPGLKVWTIQEPPPGSWKLRVAASPSNQKSSVFFIVASAKPGITITPTPTPDLKSKQWMVAGGFGLGFALCGCVIVLLLAAAVFLFVRSKRNN